MNDDFLLIQADARQLPLADESVDCCVTSPPYWGMRDYGVSDQIGLEPTPQEYVANMVAVFRQVRQALKPTGTLWLVLGDSYAGGKTGRTDHGSGDRTVRLGGSSNGAVAPAGLTAQRAVPPGLKAKDLVGGPWRVALALLDDGWYLRSDIIWAKPNCIPESVTDRPTRSHEYLFLLTKSARYFYDGDAIAEPAVGPEQEKRNKRSVWTVPTKSYRGAHFATYPEKLIEPCILAGCPLNGVVLDPFSGSGTTGRTALRLGRRYIGIDLKSEYLELAEERTEAVQVELLFQ